MSDQTFIIPAGWQMTTLGSIPNDWNLTTAEEFCVKVADGTHATPKPIENGEYLVTSKHIKDGKVDLTSAYKISKEDFTEINKRSKVDQWDVLISMIGTVGEISLINEIPNFAIKNVGLFKCEEESKAKWLFYFLRGKIGQDEIQQRMTGTTQSYVTLGDLRTFPMIVPNSEKELNTIVSVLSSLDDKIELLREQNKILEATAQVIFKEWFVNFNFPGSTGKMIDSEFGEIPEGWNVGTLNDYIGELESGKRPEGGVGQLKFGVPSVGAESINGISNFDFSKTKYISEEFFQKMNMGKVKDYDILVYKDGGTPGTFLPRFTMVGEDFPFSKFSINEHVFRVQPRKIIQRFFLYIWLNSFYCKRELQNIGGKAAIPGINSTDFRSVSLLLPNENILLSFNTITTPIFKKILTNNSQIQTLSMLRDILLPKLMKGELRVKGFNN